MSQEKLPVTVKEACRVLRCSQQTLHAWIRSGTVEASKVDGERWEVWLPAELIGPNNKATGVRLVQVGPLAVSGKGKLLIKAKSP